MLDLAIRLLDLRYADLRMRDRVRESRLAAEIARDDQRSPVLVVESGNRPVLIDGFARVRALEKLGRDTVRAAALSMGEAEALVLRHRLAAAGSATALEDGWLLSELVGTHGKSQQELATELHRSTSWISRRLALVKILPDTVQDAVRTGRVSSNAEKHLVVLARANRRHCERLVERLGTHRLTVREAGRLPRPLPRRPATQAASWFDDLAPMAFDPEVLRALPPSDTATIVLQGPNPLRVAAVYREREGAPLCIRHPRLHRTQASDRARACSARSTVASSGDCTFGPGGLSRP